MNVENGGEMYEFDKVYSFDLTGWLNIDGWTKEEVDDLMLDGRFASHLLERQIPKWWPSLVHVGAARLSIIRTKTLMPFDSMPKILLKMAANTCRLT